MRSLLFGTLSAGLGRFVLGLALAGPAGGAAAQNLVVNPGFESFSQCPAFLGQVNGYVDDWVRTGFGSTDYLNLCDYSNRAPRTGEGYVGMLPFDSSDDYREFITGRLSQTLEAGTTYRVELWVVLAEGRVEAISEISVHFSETPPSFPDSAPHPEIVPQVTNGSGLLDDKVGWMHVDETFVADGTEAYLTIGNFLDDAATDEVFLGCCGSFGAYYFLDDVSVSKVDGETCLVRADLSSLRPHVPARELVYLDPRGAGDLALDAPPRACPFSDGDLEPDPAALDDGVALSLYQLDRPIDSLRLEKAGTTIRFRF